MIGHRRHMASHVLKATIQQTKFEAECDWQAWQQGQFGFFGITQLVDSRYLSILEGGLSYYVFGLENVRDVRDQSGLCQRCGKFVRLWRVNPRLL